MARGRTKKISFGGLRNILLWCMGVVAVGGVIVGVSTFLRQSSYFTIKKVRCVGINSEQVLGAISRDFLHANIFQIDLKEARDHLRVAYPQFYDVEVDRNLPSVLTVKIIQRKPLCQIQHRGFFLIDKDGVIVSDEMNEPQEELMVIRGLSGISSLSFGQRIHAKELQAALLLIEMLQHVREEISLLADQSSSGQPLIAVDVQHYPSLYVVCGDIELRFHHDYLVRGIRTLKDLVPSLRSKIKTIHYIDLRFADPAVAFKHES